MQITLVDGVSLVGAIQFWWGWPSSRWCGKSHTGLPTPVDRLPCQVGRFPNQIHTFPCASSWEKAVWSTVSDPWSTEVHFRQLASQIRIDTLLCCDYKLRRQAQTTEMKP